MPHSCSQFGIVLLDVANVSELMNIIAGIHNARYLMMPAPLDELLLYFRGDGPRTVVADDYPLNIRQQLFKILHELGLESWRHRRFAFLVNTHDLLAYRSPSARNDARLGNCRSFFIAEQPRRIGTIRFQCCFKPFRCIIEPQQSDSKDIAAQRCDVVDNVGRPTSDDFFTRLFEHQHRCFTGNTRNAAIQIDICYHIADNQNIPSLYFLNNGSQLFFHYMFLLPSIFRQDQSPWCKLPADSPGVLPRFITQDQLGAMHVMIPVIINISPPVIIQIIPCPQYQTIAVIYAIAEAAL